VNFEYSIEAGDFGRAGYASSQVKKLLKQLNVDPAIIRRIVVALYEAEVNVVAHAYRGKIMTDIDTSRVRVIVEDEGPGIESLELAMQEGYSTASHEVRQMGFGAGMGLPNMKKNADVLNIDTVVGIGTKVELITYLGGEHGR
jgi:serine/threonine-protein kinase RsbT